MMVHRNGIGASPCAETAQVAIRTGVGWKRLAVLSALRMLLIWPGVRYVGGVRGGRAWLTSAAVSGTITAMLVAHETYKAHVQTVLTAGQQPYFIPPQPAVIEGVIG